MEKSFSFLHSRTRFFMTKVKECFPHGFTVSMNSGRLFVYCMPSIFTRKLVYEWHDQVESNGIWIWFCTMPFFLFQLPFFSLTRRYLSIINHIISKQTAIDKKYLWLLRLSNEYNRVISLHFIHSILSDTINLSFRYLIKNTSELWFVVGDSAIDILGWSMIMIACYSVLNTSTFVRISMCR